MDAAPGSSAAELDAVTLLVADHRRVEALWNEVAAGGDRTTLVDTIVRELSVHDGIEKQLLYPMLRSRVEGGAGMADRGLADHQKVEELLDALAHLDPGSDDAYRTLRQTMDEVREHVADEEARLFPALQAALDHEELLDLGASLETAKTVAPTHPHPASPNAGAPARVAGMVGGLVDHARDAVAGRPAADDRSAG